MFLRKKDNLRLLLLFEANATGVVTKKFVSAEAFAFGIFKAKIHIIYIYSL